MRKNTPALAVAFLIAALFPRFSPATEGEDIYAPKEPEPQKKVAKQKGTKTKTATPEVSGRITVKATLFDEDSPGHVDQVTPGDPNTKRGFNLEKVRLGVSGRIEQDFDYNVTLGYDSYPYGLQKGDTGIALNDAFVNFRRFPFANLGFGKAKLPLSAQSMTSSADLQLFDRAVAVREITPGRDVGVILQGAIRPSLEPIFARDGVRYFVSVSNGGGHVLTGDNNGKPMYAGRLELNFLDSVGKSESCMERGGPAVSVGANAAMNFDAESTSKLGSADFRLKWWGASLRAEALYEKRTPEYSGIQAPAPFPEAIEKLGWFVQAGFLIVPQTLEVAARYDRYDGNLEYEDLGYRPDYSKLQSFTGGVSYFAFGEKLKIQLDYVHRDELDQKELNNNSLYLLTQLRF